MIQKSFEKNFYIPLGKSHHLTIQDPNLDGQYNIDKNLVNIRGIYKDVFGSSLKYPDYQVRPNVCVAMVVVRY